MINGAVGWLWALHTLIITSVIIILIL